MNAREDYYERAQRGNGSRSPEELQADIERHRDNIDHTLLALESKLSPGELLDEGLHYLKSGPGELLANLGRTAKDNPVPVALTGIGLAWLMLSQNHSAGSTGRATEPQERASEADRASLYAHYLSQEYPFEEDEIDWILYEDLGPEAYERYQYRGYPEQEGGMQGRAARWKERAGEAASGAGEKAGEWSENARANAAELREKSRARMRSIQLRMAEATDEVRERMDRARDVAWRRTQRTGAAAAAHARSAGRQAADFFERYPLSMVALGVAAGAALGTSLPETHREDRLMGGASDRSKRQARSAAQHQTERVSRAAAAARDAALAEAEAQGLTGEELKRRGEELREKAESVAEAARTEAEQQGLTAEAAQDQVHKAREKVDRVAGAAREAAERESRERS
jgi:hypothetical protein